ncbi:hypothetical protein GC169_10250 [bacterium]|nr:hypothetical protein [bacterium]
MIRELRPCAGALRWSAVAALITAATVPPGMAQQVFSAVAPGSRAAVVGSPSTAFAVMLNAGSNTLTGCVIALDAGYTGELPATFSFQTADASNRPSGTPGAAATIPPGSAQNFILSLTPTAAFAGREIGFRFRCNEGEAQVFEGVNTLSFSAEGALQPDLIPIAATPSGDGVIRIGSVGGSGVMAAAVVNIGAAGVITVSADTGRYAWPLNLSTCETGSGGACLAPPSSTPFSVAFAAGQTRFFSVFVSADPRRSVPFLPDIARVALRFSRPDGAAAGAVSAAVTAAGPAFTPRPLNFAAAANRAFADGARALLIQRDGETLYEDYRGTGGATTQEILNSGTKSFSCGVAALARDHRLFNPDDFAYSGLPYWAPGGAAADAAVKSQIRGRDLIAISHGIPAGVPLGDLGGLDSYQEVLQATSRFAPDRQALYGRPGFQAFAAMFEGRTGGAWTGTDVVGGLDAARYLDEQVLRVIGAGVTFNRDQKGKPNFTSGAVTTARDWARYGQLIIDDGRWRGQQLLQPSSVRRCMHYQTPAYLGYGLSFWLNRPVGNSYTPGLDAIPTAATDFGGNSGQILPAAPDDMYVAWGAGNMQMFMIPSERLVIVKFAGSGDQNAFFEALFSPVG